MFVKQSVWTAGAVAVALMIAGGAALEEFAEARARRELAALIGRTSRTAHRRNAEGLTGEAGPAALTNRVAVGRLVEEHARIRALLDRMRRAADRVDRLPGDHGAELRRISATLNELLLPHQLAEKQTVFPELAQRLGGRDPLGSMTRMHDEIAHLAVRFEALVAGLSEDGASEREAREARRLLYALDAVIALHLTVEEEMLSQVEDLAL